MAKKRINTQIPRRQKASPTAPMQSEWDDREGVRASGLKMPANAMVSKKREPGDSGDSASS